MPALPSFVIFEQFSRLLTFFLFTNLVETGSFYKKFSGQHKTKKLLDVFKILLNKVSSKSAKNSKFETFSNLKAFNFTSYF